MTAWRYLSADHVGAADGLAVDEAVTLGYTRDGHRRPPTLRLYTYRSHCALVGRYQHLDAEVRLDACRALGVDVNRRPTGGGAIVMGEGQLGVAISTFAPAERRPRQLLEEFSAGIVAGLARAGITAEFRGKNDLAVDGRKIAGLGLYLDGSGGLLFHASVLADLDVELMLAVLDIPAAKLGERAALAVNERVTTISRETGRPWDGARLRPVVAEGIAAELGVELVPGELDPAERHRADQLVASRYGTAEWAREYSPRTDATATATLRLGAGTARVYLASHDRTVKSLLFTGDFNSVPAPLVAIEEQLRWKRLEAAVVEEVVTRCLAGHPEVAEPTAVTAAILAAAERAGQGPGAGGGAGGGAAAESAGDRDPAGDAEPDGEQPLSAPERVGSCYFPEVVDAL